MYVDLQPLPLDRWKNIITVTIILIVMIIIMIVEKKLQLAL